MKINYVLLFGLITGLSVTTSCSDKKDDPTEKAAGAEVVAEKNAAENDKSLAEKIREDDESEGVIESDIVPSPIVKPSADEAAKMKVKDENGYLTSVPIEDQQGYIFNPYTYNVVDVRGVPSGALVRDPMDPNPEHKFKVP